MPPRQLLNTGIASAVLLGLLMVLAPSPALASNMWSQQALLLVVKLGVHLKKSRVARECREQVRNSQNARLHNVLEPGLPPLLRMDVKEGRFVELRLDDHVAQIGNLHQPLTFADRLSLGDNPLLVTAPRTALLRTVIDYDATPGAVERAGGVAGRPLVRQPRTAARGKGLCLADGRRDAHAGGDPGRGASPDCQDAWVVATNPHK